MLASQDLKSVSQLFSYLNSIHKKMNVSTHVFIVSIEKPVLPNQIEEFAKYNGLISEFRKKSDDLYLFTVGARTNYDEGYLITKKDFWVFITDEDGYNIQRFVRNLHPLLKLIFVDSDSILRLVQEANDKFKLINLVEGTLCSKGETFRNWKKEPIKFSIPSLHKMANNKDAKWSGITLLCYKEGEAELKLRINEQGHLALYRGQFTDLYEIFILPYISEGLRIKTNFVNRERKVCDGEIKLNPIFMNIKEELSIIDIGILKKALLKNYLGAVMHAGNPILMMQITDKSDGSSFDIYASKRKIEVVPLTKSSSASLTGVFSLISDMLPSVEMDVRGGEFGQ